jgi:hypothetical protein
MELQVFDDHSDEAEVDRESEVTMVPDATAHRYGTVVQVRLGFA